MCGLKPPRATPEISGANIAVTQTARRAARRSLPRDKEDLPLTTRALVIEGDHALRSSLSPFFQNTGLDLYGAA